MEFTGTHVACYLNDALVQTGELPYFNAIETVATDDDREVILKITNMGDTAEPVEITLDCDVEADYQLGLLTGDPAARNSLDNPENVHETWIAQSGAAQSFTYEAPACSVNVLRLTKK